MKWRVVTDLPKEMGWYLLRATNAHPSAVGRSWFDGNIWNYGDTARLYLNSAAALEWLDESQPLPEQGVFTLEQLLDFADHYASGTMSGMWSNPFKGNIQIAKEYFKEKYGINL